MTRTISMKLSILVAAFAIAGAAACDDDETTPPKQGSGGAAGSSTGGSGTGAAGSGATSGAGGTAASGGSSGTGAVAGGGAGGSAGTDGGADAEADAGPNNVAYPGAPPTMLHDPYGCTNNCLTCHEQGDSGAPKTPHPERPLCRQCHLPQANVPLWVGNDFGK